MKNISYEEYVEYYKDNNEFYCRSYINKNKTYTNSQINQKYKKYLQKIEKQQTNQDRKFLEKKEKYEKQKEEYIQKVINNELEFEIDEKWENVSTLIWKRDNFECRFIKILNEEEKQSFDKLVSNYQRENLEVAHCISRAKSKKLYYELNNLYLINYFSHRSLDEFRSPLTGEAITTKEVVYWWKRIINNDNLYEWLEENK